MQKRLAVVLVLCGALLAVPAAEARVRLISVTPSSPGSYATLVAAVSPARRCSITVHYKSGPSRAQGLGPKTPSRGRVSWRWKVGTNTTPGRWPIAVSCGTAGTLRTSFLVR
jgi:hypothetical protein